LKDFILIVSTEFPPLPGGIGNHAYNLASELSKNYERVIVLTEERANSKIDWNDFCNSSEFKIIGIKRNRFIFYTYLKRIFYFFYLSIKLRPVTFFSGKFSIWLAAFNPSKKKSFAIIHGSEIKCFGIWNRIFHMGLNKVAKIISVSNFTQKILLKSYEINALKCCVINNGFNMEIEKSCGTQKKLNTPLEFITIGGMHQRKGQHNFIAALPKIIECIGNVKYNIAGIPQELDRLKILATSLDVLKHINFYESPTNEEVLNLLKKSNIFVMLSENLENGDFEGFGIAVLEAMSMGLPAIGSKNTGIEDAILNHYCGVLVNHSSIENILNSVIEIKTNYLQFSNNAIEWSEKFRWENVIRQYECLLK
jgi:phosphatidylinositol alpha-1,6-mannosyltransferase